MTKREEIFETFKSKSCVKQDVFSKTKSAFQEIKLVLESIARDYQTYLHDLDERVTINYRDEGEYGAILSFGGDVLVFQMHSNVFTFEEGSPILNHSYVKKNPSRAFCGVINVYNFLADSFRYNRENDLGYLVSRIFVNEESHLFVEGKKDLGYRFTDFAEQVVNSEILTNIIESSIKFSLEFDLYVPEFTNSQLVTVAQMKQLSQDQKIATAKRLGFKMQHEKGKIY